MKDEEPAGGVSPSSAALGLRWAEVAVAAFLLLLGLVVLGDSLRVGARWGDDGPQAGYFPFYIGLGLSLASAGLLGQQLWRWRQERRVFVSREAARMVFAVLWPMVVYVAVMPFVGLYVASALLIGWFMRRHGRFGWAACAATALGVVVGVYLVFQRWFLVALPKGPLESWLGL
jgi:hypothetical protein